MKLYCIRHGENLANIQRIFSYRAIDYDLTPKGLEEAHYLAAWLADHNIVSVYSSPLKRALQTAGVIRERLDLLDINIIEELREINVGHIEGKNDPTSWEYHDDIIQRWFDGEADLAFEGGENHQTIRARLKEALYAIVENNPQIEPDQGIAIVAHGGIFTLGLPGLCHNLTMSDVRSGLKNTAVSVVEVTGNSYNCLHWGIIDHLPQA